jgi:hypothetical protein
MKSIAIWYKPSEIEDAYLENVELHFNLWKLPNGSSDYLRFLDIGIKLDNTKAISELKLYFPFKLESQDFEDIIHRFITKPDLVSAIFNENYKTTSYATSKTYKITDSNDEFVFNVYQTSKEDISFEDKYSGTIVKIKCPESDKKTYFRFRIKGPYLDSLSTIQKPSNSFIQSAFSKTEMVDFRVNEARDLNQSLLEEINKERKLKIKKAHFFFICSYNEDVLGSHQPYSSCRNLENYRWIDYVGVENLRNQIFLAYQWKQDENRNDLNILIKTKFEKSSWKTILLYLAVLLVLTVVFNLISNWIFESIK